MVQELTSDQRMSADLAGYCYHQALACLEEAEGPAAALEDEELMDLHRAVVDGVRRLGRRLDEKMGRDDAPEPDERQMDLTELLDERGA